MRTDITGFSGTKASPGMNLDDQGRVVYGTWFADYDNGLPVSEPRFLPNTIQPGMVDGTADTTDDVEFPSAIAGAALATAVAVVCAVIIIGVSIYAGLVV